MKTMRRRAVCVKAGLFAIAALFLGAAPAQAGLKATLATRAKALQGRPEHEAGYVPRAVLQQIVERCTHEMNNGSKAESEDLKAKIHAAKKELARMDKRKYQAKLGKASGKGQALNREIDDANKTSTIPGTKVIT